MQMELPMVGRVGEEIMEAGEQRRSLWVSIVEHRLHILKVSLQRKVEGFQILKVPQYQRQPTAHFTPVEWRFGLHNRENHNTTGSEDMKLALVVLLGLEEQSKWIDFCDFVVPDPWSMLTCYGLHEEVINLIADEIKQVLALDALYLAVHIEINFMDSESRRLWTFEHVKVREVSEEHFLLNSYRWKDTLAFDLCKIENQVPFALIKQAIKYIKRLTNPLYEDEDHIESVANSGQVEEPSLEQQTQLAANEGIMRRTVDCIKRLLKPQHEGEDHPLADARTGEVLVPYLEEWMKLAVREGIFQFMDVSDDFYKHPNAHLRLSKSDHILDATYLAICGNVQRTQDFSQKAYIHIPPAWRLKDSGIKIVGVVGPLCTMSYDKEKKCLRLPKMRLFDGTVGVIRNMARHEQYSKGSSRTMFIDYVVLMLDLAQSLEDIKILSDCGVIDNGCGYRAFETWNGLDQSLAQMRSSKEHNEMKRSINSICKLQRYRLWSEFKQLWNEFRQLFLSRPWLTLSTITITFVTFATLIQTYAAVIGSNGMKPQFKP